MAAYVSVANLRPSSTPAVGGSRWPDISVTTAQAADTPLGVVCQDASDYFDLLTGDHWGDLAYTYNAGTPPNYGLLILDGPRPNAFGRGGKVVFVPERIQTLNAVYFVPPQGTPILLPSTAYMMHSSLNDAAGYDGIELLGQAPYLDEGSPWAYQWQTYPRSVGLDGTFGHHTVPEDVARATAHIVIDWLRNSGVPARATQHSSGRASFNDAQANLDVPQPTGNPYVDRVIAQRRRKSWMEPV